MWGAIRPEKHQLLPDPPGNGQRLQLLLNSRHLRAMTSLGQHQDQVCVPQALLGPRSCSWVTLVDYTVVAILLLTKPGVQSVVVGWLEGGGAQLGLFKVKNDEEELKTK